MAAKEVMKTKTNIWGLSYAKILFLLFLILLVFPGTVAAEPLQLPNLNLQIGGGAGEPQDLSVALQLIILITVLTLAPAILIMLTSFTRIMVVLAFIRTSLATQQMPPNQLLIGMALFLTFFVMAPTFQEVNSQALQPYFKGKITQEQAFEKGMSPLRSFMFKQTREKDLALFVKMSKMERPHNFKDIPNYVLIPSFVISELKTAFQIGFIIFIPFLIIDMVVASALMSMGMMMLPPMMISLPFKILLFVLVDGWNLVIQSLILSFK